MSSMDKTFVSDISQKNFSESEKVHLLCLNKGVVKALKKKYKSLNDNSIIALSELNDFLPTIKMKTFLGIFNRGKAETFHADLLQTISNKDTITDKLDDNEPEPTLAQSLADKIAVFGGSWTFIISFFSFILIWILINIGFLISNGFDPYPFILLNLILSCLASIQAPIIMMSQNRQDEKDRIRAQKDYLINLKAELEIRELHQKVDTLAEIISKNISPKL